MQLRKISQIARDPLAHLSIESGEGIALFVLGGCIGWILKAVVSGPICGCWFGLG